MSTGEDYYIGVDVGTGSARACVINAAGEIKGLASEDIRLWKASYGIDEIHYEQSTTDIWRHICGSVRSAVAEAGIEASAIRGIGFDATCSLAVFSHDTDEPITVTKSGLHQTAGDEDHRNIILWLDHRALAETDAINATGHNLLRYVGGTMNVEMEMPKVLWLKNHMPADVFARCKFYDLADALTHLATGNETRSFCSTVCKQGFVPVGVDGSVKGWQEDFYQAVGLGELAEDNFKRVGGVNGVNGHYLSAGELVGPLSAKAAAELGLEAGIAVGSGVIDAYAGWIGTVGAPVDLGDKANDVSQAFTRLAAVAGTSTCHLAMSRNAVFVDGVWGPYRDVMLPDFWMAEGGQSATGELIRHVVETHPAFAEVSATSAESQTNIYEYLNNRLRALASEAGSPAVGHLTRHLFFYGDLWGNRSPLADPHMRGALVGMSSTDNLVDGLALLYYAALEFIALQTRQIVDTMNAAGHELRSVFMSGSQCRNDLLVSLVATACGLPVVIPRYDNAAVVHGAAMLGAKAASGGADKGATEPLWTIMSRMTQAGRVVHPSDNVREVKLLQAKYEVMLDQLKTQRAYRSKVDAAVAGWTK
ncbi:ribitol kinase [Sporothrix schenckii 1099-18]|uniref:FGGY-family pentulose kinase n=2 Tax=Sporothrix schenckii TaxID=29908 RepID=U7PWQ7_SPOS1|nr:ribitol kinase [Sporothrix schenckii 1099-18]ERT00023.1 hypothetical protein HMPREF1624_03392 [Sporothrix schenckii ATCC 58251]KJR85552.1 ribitol kinase [Sporothrix schenckii 1099-18]